MHTSCTPLAHLSYTCLFRGPDTHHWKCQLAKNKELSIPPIWVCWGPTRNSFFTHRQIKHPPFFEGRWYTGKIIHQIWAEWAVCLNSYIWKGWMFYLSMGKKWISSGSTTIPDRWYWKLFFFLADWHFQWCVAMYLHQVMETAELARKYSESVVMELYSVVKKTISEPTGKNCNFCKFSFSPCCCYCCFLPILYQFR